MKDVYLMLTDAGGNKAVRKTRIEVIGRDLLSTIYPDPFTDNAYLEFVITSYSIHYTKLYDQMYQMHVKGVDFVVCNTDEQALRASPVPIKIQLGTSLTEGRGAGNNPEKGRQAASYNFV